MGIRALEPPTLVRITGFVGFSASAWGAIRSLRLILLTEERDIWACIGMNEYHDD